MASLVEETAAVLRGEPERVGEGHARVDRGALARQVADWTAEDRAALIEAISSDAGARRWLRADLLPRLSAAEASELAILSLDWPDDFAINRRDRSTMAVVRHLSLEELRSRTVWLAGTNVASALWRRLAYEDEGRIGDLALRVMRAGDPVARETTLHLVLLDPYQPAHFQGEERLNLLSLALDDTEDEVRGLAADILADEAPERLWPNLARWQLDPSERVRMAAWDAAFARDPARATADAAALASDETAPLDARRSALIAVGTTLNTAEVAPLLAAMVMHPEQALAEDAANLLWAQHRTPIVAEAAAHSPHPAVRAIGERLLHPDIGSPAAGGSRPGAPADQADVCDQMLRRLRDEPNQS
jgi:hypothetical protein